MNINLVIRRTKGYWKNGTWDLDKIINKTDQPSAFISKLFWNASFGMRYIDFRKRLRELNLRTVQKNDFDDVLMYFDEEKINSYSKDDLIVLIDEDDWFSPDLVKTLREIKEEPYKSNRRFYWEGYKKKIEGKIEDSRQMPVPSLWTGSCTYGLKNVDQGYKSPIKIMRHHTSFSMEGAYHVDKMLSMKVINVSSLYQMVTFLDGTLDGFKNYVVSNIELDINKSIPYPEGYKELRIQFEELLKELLASAKFDIKNYGDMV